MGVENDLSRFMKNYIFDGIVKNGGFVQPIYDSVNHAQNEHSNYLFKNKDSIGRIVIGTEC